jgi:AcrR family transcriptional regulator
MRSAIAREGFQAASVSSIAGQAYVTRPVFYRAFPGGKDECFLAVYDEAIDELLDLAATAHDNAGRGLTGIEAALRAVTMNMARSPATAHLCLIDITALGALGLKHRDAVLTRIANLLAQALGEPQPDPPLAGPKIRALVGGCYQLLYLTVAEERAAELPTLVPDMLYMLLAYRLGPASAKPHSASATSL